MAAAPTSNHLLEIRPHFSERSQRKRGGDDEQTRKKPLERRGPEVAVAVLAVLAGPALAGEAATMDSDLYFPNSHYASSRSFLMSSMVARSTFRSALASSMARFVSSFGSRSHEG